MVSLKILHKWINIFYREHKCFFLHEGLELHFCHEDIEEWKMEGQFKGGGGCKEVFLPMIVLNNVSHFTICMETCLRQ